MYSDNEVIFEKAAQIEDFLECVVKRYGYDFREYNRDVISRRVLYLQEHLGMTSLEELKERTLSDEDIFQRVLADLTIDVSCMFRDVAMFSGLREHVIPRLRSFPRIRVWVAGCASGQEAYSMSILLDEEGLGDRSLVYATDINKISLNNARKGIYPLSCASKYSRHYGLSGGANSFYDYITVGSKSFSVKRRIKEKIVFANHNLATDGAFNHFHIVLCCNVLIYFTEPLKNRALELFTESLFDFGYLVIGSKEGLSGRSVGSRYEQPIKNVNIFRKADR